MRIYEESYLLSHEKHQAYSLSSIQLGCSATLFSYCARMKIISDAKCQFIKNPQWPTMKRGLRLLRQLKCLAALKKLQQVSKLYQYDALNLLSYMKIDVKNIHSVGYHKDKLFTVLDYPMYTHTHTHTHTHIHIYIYIYIRTCGPLPITFELLFAMEKLAVLVTYSTYQARKSQRFHRKLRRSGKMSAHA